MFWARVCLSLEVLILNQTSSLTEKSIFLFLKRTRFNHSNAQRARFTTAFPRTHSLVYTYPDSAFSEVVILPRPGRDSILIHLDPLCPSSTNITTVQSMAIRVPCFFRPQHGHARSIAPRRSQKQTPL
ncbi:hypothetical protein C8F04DRAFT_218676 [Mycena alexandri]|uniref:Uncharacterized protein n=1 Tax=Mycena alexandri TaxID=1745969 RepID=A0AAD6TKK4_9AGAR|nr:hypothetical protein C8F04DRAFT_218676 [Mycena alexandri]